jgi:hypothetical protein
MSSNVTKEIVSYLYLNWVNLFKQIEKKEIGKLNELLKANNQKVDDLESVITLKPTRMGVVTEKYGESFSTDLLKLYTDGYDKFLNIPAKLKIWITISYVAPTLSSKASYVTQSVLSKIGIKTDFVSSVEYEYETVDYIQPIISDPTKQYNYGQVDMKCTNKL